MKRNIGILLLTLALGACGKATVDVSSNEVFEKTLAEAAADIQDPYTRTKVVQVVSFMYLGAQMGKLGNRQSFEESERKLQAINGKTGPELAEMLKDQIR